MKSALKPVQRERHAYSARPSSPTSRTSSVPNASRASLHCCITIMTIKCPPRVLADIMATTTQRKQQT
ncbi:hypothetical protein E2C01_035509 [Portunus trituberculatus]|uniref:Uncharacterized protein n=1 Tax=Portunus trituberculatus TaxID=210409 RepID=A0A5B7F4D6_PORTR|nr:hypothetical protein [Portunus trituberculatus]